MKHGIIGAALVALGIAGSTYAVAQPVTTDLAKIDAIVVLYAENRSARLSIRTLTRAWLAT
jgi:hypothetical protein